MNLYIVTTTDDYHYFVFAETRNRARSMCVGHMSTDETYERLNARLLKKDAGGKAAIVDCPDDSDYGRVTSLGFRYIDSDEAEEDPT